MHQRKTADSHERIEAALLGDYLGEFQRPVKCRLTI